MTCPACGYESTPDVEAEAVAEIQAESTVEAAEIHEAGETERAQIAAEAAVEIATVEAEALADAAEALADVEDQADEQPADEPASDGVTEVDVPPQADEPADPGEDVQRSTRNGGRRLGPMRRRRRR